MRKCRVKVTQQPRVSINNEIPIILYEDYRREALSMPLYENSPFHHHHG